MQEGQADFNLAEAVKTHILRTLTYCNGNRTHAAKHLGISLRCLRDKLRHYSNADAEVQRACGPCVASNKHPPGGIEVAEVTSNTAT
jgi:Bacterial regulatory protein, Fis family